MRSFVCTPVALVAGLLGCSSPSEPTTAADVGGDAGDEASTDAKPDVKPDGPIFPEFTCGPAPWVNIDFTVEGLTIVDPGARPTGPVKITSTLCPEVPILTDAEGYVVLKMSVEKPFSFRFDPPGTTHLPTRWASRTLHAWSDSPYFTVVDAAAKPQLPASIDKGVLMVDVAGEAGSCGRADVVVTVKDHPEAVVKYHLSSKPYGPSDTLTGTSSLGIAAISGLPAGATVTVEGTKAGCEVVQAVDPGTVLLEANTISRAHLFVRTPHPVCGPAPWILLGGTLTDRMLDGSKGAALKDAKVTFDACAGVSTTTGADGHWDAWVSTGMPTFRTFELTGYLTGIGNELAFPFSYSTLDSTLGKSDTWKTKLPGWDDTKGYAIVNVVAVGALPATCKDLSGITIDVKGAKVVYVDGDPPAATGGAVTTKKGLAYVSGLAPGVLDGATFTGAKAGCAYAAKRDIDSGRVKVVAGAISSVTLYGG